MLSIACGSPTTMPVKMISDMPLPMPRSLICSPSHMMKAGRWSAKGSSASRTRSPGLITMPCCIDIRPCAMPNDCRTERMMVR